MKTIDTGITENDLMQALVEEFNQQYRQPGEFSLFDFMQAAGCGEKSARKFIAEQLAAGKLTSRRVKCGEAGRGWETVYSRALISPAK